MLNGSRMRWLVIALLLFHSTFNIQHSTLAAQTAFAPASEC